MTARTFFGSPYRITTVVWAVVCVVHTALSLHWYLTCPDPFDSYDKTFVFQAGVWLVLGLPIWLLILGVLLLLVRFGLFIRASCRHPSGSTR